MASETLDKSVSLFEGFKRLYAHFSTRRKRQLLILLGLMLIGAVAEVVTLGAVLPFLALLADPGKAASFPVLQELFSALGWRDPGQILIPATLLFAFTAISAGAIRLFLTWASQKYVFRLGHDLGVEVYRRTLFQPYSYHVSTNSSELIAGINKVQIVVGGVLLPIMQVITGAVISLFIFGMLIIIDAGVALIAATGFGIMYLAVSFATRARLRSNSKVIAHGQTQRIKIVQEGLGGIRDVLIDQAQPVYLDKFKKSDLALRDAQAMNMFIGAAPRFVIEACGMVLIAILALFLSQGSGGLVTALPVLGALALGAQRLLPLLQLVYNSWAQIVGNRQLLFDTLTILDLPIHPRFETPSQVTPLPFEQGISLNSVSFRYNEGQPLVLDKVTLTIEKGARVGFIGKTGSGKSTIMDLIMGLLEPTAGEIRIDGQVLTVDNLRGWQANIAHVPQAIFLADTTIAENIAFGVPEDEVVIDRVQDAARQAELSEFIESLPEGYKTVVGERGIRLSGGQRQRIGIARALYKQANVLVFDEATSALDSETEAAVMSAIDSLHRDLTILIIAHRLSTVAVCDKVVKLDDGHIVAEGSHEAVVQSGQSQISQASSGLKKHAH